jgi:hypothetical protein
MALNGLFPGLVTTRSVANLGVFEIEVIIEPTYPGGGGGYVPGAKPDKYKVTIRVTMKNGRVWNYSRVVTNTIARVIAKLTGVKFEEQPDITVTSVVAHKVITDVRANKK